MAVYRFLLDPLLHFTAEVAHVEKALAALSDPWSLWMTGIVTDNALLEVETEDPLGLSLAVEEALSHVESRPFAVGQALHPEYSSRVLLAINRSTQIQKLARGLNNLFHGKVDISALGKLTPVGDKYFLLSFTGDAGLVEDLATENGAVAAVFEPAREFGPQK